MSKYPIKMLKDEEGKPFVPLVSADTIYTDEDINYQEALDKKLEVSNLKSSDSVIIKTNGNDATFEVDFGATDNIIDNLNTTVAGQGPLDAHQGYVLKNMIPAIADNLTTADANKTLSANQGVVLSGRSVAPGGNEGQVLKKASNKDYDLEWGDAADPNAIVGDGSIMSIIELTYEEYKELESAGQLQEDAEYHITDVESGTSTYLNEEDIREITQEVYSTTEQKIGMWIDTKPLYKKVINTTSPSEIGVWTTVGVLSNLDELINMYGSLTGADGRKLPLNHGEPSYAISTTYLSPNIEMKIEADNWVGREVFIILEYTKTTDLPTAITSGAQALSYASKMLGGDSNISSGYGLRLYSTATQTSPEGYECYCCCIRDVSTLNNEAWIYVYTDPSKGIAFDSEGYGEYSYIIDTSLIDTSVVYLIS